MLQKLPENGRPRLNNYRKCAIGIDLPCAFFDDLKAIDNDLYVVWHPYQLLYDEIANAGDGTSTDPRYAIQDQFGHLCFGYVMRTITGAPMPDSTWHVWRYAWPHGWVHVVQLKSTDPEYLGIVAKNLFFQKQLLAKYGPKAFSRDIAEKDDKKKADALKAKDEMHKMWQLENKWLIKKAMDNMASGFTQATNPTKDIIISGSGLGHRTKRIVPIDEEKDGGVYNG